MMIRFFTITFLFSCLFPSLAFSRLEIDINKGHVDALPIALPAFLGNTPFSADISQVVTSDLAGSGLFNVLDSASFIERITDTNAPPNFVDWQAIQASALVVGRVVATQDGGHRTEFRLWDTYAGEQIIGRQYVTNENNWRRIAHIIADAIYESLSGEKGYFDSRIVFVDESGPKERRVKRLAIMDQDGADTRYLTDGADLVLTPRFSRRIRRSPICLMLEVLREFIVYI